MSVTADLGQPVASTSAVAIGGTGEERQIAIRLSTKDPLYQIPPAKFLVPASWRRFHLSELINKVLENGELVAPTDTSSLPVDVNPLVRGSGQPCGIFDALRDPHGYRQLSAHGAQTRQTRSAGPARPRTPPALMDQASQDGAG